MKRIATLLIGLLLLTAVFVLAQDTLGLSPDDFTLFSSANSTGAKSFTFTYAAHLAVDGLDTFAIKSDLNGSGAVDTDAHALDLNMDGTATLGTSQNITSKAEIRLLNDTLYFNPGDGWQSRKDASQFASDLLGQIAVLDADPSALVKWDLSGISGLSDVLKDLKDIPPSSFLTVKRMDDETTGDNQTAHFHLAVDLHAMMGTDEFVNVVSALADAQGTPWNSAIKNHTELSKIVQANNALFDKVTLGIDEYVGLDDKLIHRLVLNLNIPLDPSILGYVDPPFTVSGDLDITLSSLNQPQIISAPDDAKDVDAFTLLPAAPLQPPGQGTTEYVFFETVGDNATYMKPFEAKGGDKVTISVRALGLDFDPNTALLSSDGQKLAENQDHDANVFGLDTYDAQIADFAIPKDGTYEAQVTEYGGASGSFVLTITVKR